jgi:hypothetical protein
LGYSEDWIGYTDRKYSLLRRPNILVSRKAFMDPNPIVAQEPEDLIMVKEVDPCAEQ